MEHKKYVNYFSLTWKKFPEVAEILFITNIQEEIINTHTCCEPTVLLNDNSFRLTDPFSPFKSGSEVRFVSVTLFFRWKFSSS